MPRKITRRPRRKALRKPRRKMRKNMGSSRDFATITECVEQQLNLNANGSYGYNFTTSLSEFNRAQEVAHAYKFYRCKNITLEFIPYANISTVGAAAGNRLPQFYFSVDRVANHYILPTEDEMLERGLKPILFKKIIKRSFKPSLLQNVQLEVGQSADGAGNPLGVNTIGAVNSVPLFDKWLPTQQSYGYTQSPPNVQAGHTMAQPAINPYALRYYGAVFVIDQENGTTAVIGDIVTKVTWEFKGQRALKTEPPGNQNVVSDVTSMINPGVVANTQPTSYP